MISGFAILVWLPSAIRTTFPQDVEQFAIINSLVKGLAGSFSSVAGGESLSQSCLRELRLGCGRASFQRPYSRNESLHFVVDKQKNVKEFVDTC